MTRFIYPNFRNYRQIYFLRGNKFENTSSSTHLFWVIVVGGDNTSYLGATVNNDNAPIRDSNMIVFIVVKVRYDN